jgi:hypothetical protein
MKLLGAGNRGAGLGDASILPADPLTQATADLVAWLVASPCTQNAVTQVSDFQTAWNTSTLGGTLTVDGKYGPQTRGALQAAMNAAGTGSAPADCFTSASAVCPQAAAAASFAPWIIGTAVVAGAGVIAYTYWQLHHARGGRR